MIKKLTIILIFLNSFNFVKSVDKETIASTGIVIGAVSSLLSSYFTYQSFKLKNTNTFNAKPDDDDYSFLDCGKKRPSIYLSINTLIHAYMIYLSVLLYKKNKSSIFYKIHGIAGLFLGSLAACFWIYKGCIEKEKFLETFEFSAAGFHSFLMFISGLMFV